MSIPHDFERVLHRFDGDVNKADETMMRESLLGIRVRLRKEPTDIHTLAALRCELASTLTVIRQAEARMTGAAETETEREAA
jgi:hypothetical protein